MSTAHRRREGVCGCTERDAWRIVVGLAMDALDGGNDSAGRWLAKAVEHWMQVRAQ